MNKVGSILIFCAGVVPFLLLYWLMAIVIWLFEENGWRSVFVFPCEIAWSLAEALCCGSKTGVEE
jgi:hypothetical protein